MLLAGMFATAVYAQSEAGDTSYTANYFIGMEDASKGKICKDIEVKVDIRKEIPRWSRDAILKELSDKLKPAGRLPYPPEDSLFKTCESWETEKMSLIADIMFWEPGDQMCVVYYLDEEDCCAPRKNKRSAYVHNLALKNKDFYQLEPLYKKYKTQIDQDVMSNVRRKYRSNRDRRFINMITIEELPPLGFNKGGLVVFTRSAIGGKNQHVPWVVSQARLPETLPTTR